jgi:cellulose synthase/poly-beta-1,6-N-acetylglucosamine synthase-like glycosyltransferase
MAAGQEELAEVATDLGRLSDGNVRKVTRGGPVLAAGHPPRRRLRAGTLTWALSGQDRLLVAGLTAGWLAALAWFWVWWLQPEHRLGSLGLVVNSVVLGYVSFFPVFFVAGANRLRRVSPAVSVPAPRVAFLVTRAPAEPWSIARSTLSAMASQSFPSGYDIWLCDERPGQDVLSWCRRHAVMVSTRDGVKPYQRQNWPRRTRCKEGNLAYFYDSQGYRDYDIVVQLDCDHRPTRTYLSEMVRPFADPAVGYVAAPSVCDANAEDSWSARGRVYREATFHGPFQLGHSDGFGPLCIGSHYAVRTAALRDIGGIGPELAEDFSTTFLLNAAGWQGVFAIDAEAHGLGPPTFAAMIVQEFQWARSLTTILLGLVPSNLGRLPWRLRARFLYALSYYSLLVSTTIAGLLLAPIAAVTGVPWINVSFAAFLLHWWPIAACLLLMALLLRRRGLLRPPDSPVISWESWLYALSRWPYVALGIWAAIGQAIRPRPIHFKLTQKGTAGLQPLPVRLVVPYFGISIACSGAALIGERISNAAGYVFLSMIAAVMYAIVAAAVPVLHASEAAARTGVSRRAALRGTAPGPLALAAIAVVPTVAAAALFPAYAARLFGW